MDVFVFAADVDTLVVRMNGSSRPLLLAAGIFGFTGVTLGALGAHQLREFLTQRDTLPIWQMAVSYQLIHAVALLALAGRSEKSPLVAWSGACWMTGVVLFSGSLFGLALGGPRVLGPVTPLGGLLLLAGWVVVMVDGWKSAGK